MSKSNQNLQKTARVSAKWGEFAVKKTGCPRPREDFAYLSENSGKIKEVRALIPSGAVCFQSRSALKPARYGLDQGDLMDFSRKYAKSPLISPI